jgi:hypothetical protein
VSDGSADASRVDGGSEDPPLRTDGGRYVQTADLKTRRYVQTAALKTPPLGCDAATYEPVTPRRTIV